MPAPSRRRWFRFSLRGLLVAVAVLSIPGAYVAHEWRIVRERKALREEFGGYDTMGWVWGSKQLQEPQPLSWLRRAFGDEPLNGIRVYGWATKDTVNRVRNAFPEAQIDDSSLNYWANSHEQHTPQEP